MILYIPKIFNSKKIISGTTNNLISFTGDSFDSSVEKLKKYGQIIVCCRSGNRSGQAQRVLESKGFKNITNGGSWQNVNQYK